MSEHDVAAYAVPALHEEPVDRRAQGEHLDDGTGLGPDRQQPYVAPVGQLAEDGHGAGFDESSPRPVACRRTASESAASTNGTSEPQASDTFSTRPSPGSSRTSRM